MKVKTFLVSILLAAFFCIETSAAATRITDLSVTNVGATSVTLEWTVPTSTTNLFTTQIRTSPTVINTINWATKPTVPNVPPPTAQGSRQTLTVSNLTPNTTNYFGVKVLDLSLKWSLLSNVPYIKTATVAAEVTLAWDPSTDADVVGYRLYSNDSTGGSSVLDVYDTTSVSLSNITRGVTYTFYVTCYTEDERESDPSIAVVFTPPL